VGAFYLSMTSPDSPDPTPRSRRALWVSLITFVVVVGGIAAWHRAIAVAASISIEDVWARPDVWRIAGQADWAGLIAVPPGPAIDPLRAGERFHDLLTAGAVVAPGYRQSTWRADSIWAQGDLRRARQVLGAFGPENRLRWVTEAAAGEWGDDEIAAVRRLPFLSGAGDMVTLARAEEIDLIAGRYDVEPPRGPLARLRPSAHWEYLWDAWALTAAEGLAQGRPLTAVVALADAVRLAARWAAATPDPREAATALSVFDEFRRAYLLAVTAADSGMGQRLRVLMDSIDVAVGMPPAKPSVLWSPKGYLAAVAAQPPVTATYVASAYHRAAAMVALHACGSSPADAPLEVTYPGEGSWPGWARSHLRPAVKEVSCRASYPLPWLPREP
jgi:hypothetical protein